MLHAVGVPGSHSVIPIDPSRRMGAHSVPYTVQYTLADRDKVRPGVLDDVRSHAWDDRQWKSMVKECLSSDTKQQAQTWIDTFTSVRDETR